VAVNVLSFGWPGADWVGPDATTEAGIGADPCAFLAHQAVMPSPRFILVLAKSQWSGATQVQSAPP
jgi:hypothetical protein